MVTTFLWRMQWRQFRSEYRQTFHSNNLPFMSVAVNDTYRQPNRFTRSDSFRAIVSIKIGKDTANGIEV